MAVLASHEPCVMDVQHHAAAAADRIGRQLRLEARCAAMCPVR